ncbi:MAG: diacylglycerol kinase family protein [Planctomycetia bacterium]|nr:diacylglycerol kinase family protein [Planctomycetia bacterium]
MSARLSSQADNVIISVNPKAGRASPMRRAEELAAVLRQRGFTVELMTDLAEVAQKANSLTALAKLRALVGVGGDGTAAELVNRTTPDTPITLLPAGTANLLAKQFRIPFDSVGMANMIEQGHTIRLDAGRAVSSDKERLFLVMFSAGIDADIVRQVHRRREEKYKQKHKSGAHISYCSYVGPIFRSIASYRYPLVEIESASELLDDDNWEQMQADQVTRQACRWPFVFNLPRYGWGVTFNPRCRGNDGKLDYCFFKRGWIIPAVWNVAMAQFGGLHRLMPGTSLGTGKAFRMTSSGEVPFQLDGDFAGYLPVSIRIVPERFTAIVPEKVALKSRYICHDDPT